MNLVPVNKVQETKSTTELYSEEIAKLRLALKQVKSDLEFMKVNQNKLPTILSKNRFIDTIIEKIKVHL